MNIEAEIHLNKFKPRPYQIRSCLAFESGKFKKFIDIEPRRSGKDFKWWNLIIRQAFRRVGLYLYALPTFAQARSVIWEGKSNTGSNFLEQIPKECIAKMRHDTMTINLINGSIIRLVGSDSYNTSIIGSNPVGIIFSEYALCDENAYKLAALPIMKANDGFVALISTPRGKNHLYELYQIARNSDDWFTEFLTIDDTLHISSDEVRAEIASGEISEDLALQEYYCFTPDMYVNIPDNIKKIKDIEVGDIVISHTNNQRMVTGIMKRHYEGTLIIIKCFAAFQTVKCTPNHLFQVVPENCNDDREHDSIWKSANQLTTDDRIVFPLLNGIARINSIAKEDYNGIVHNISVEEDESYCVAGVSVHNCSFERGQEGSYYAKYLDKMKLKGQIGSVPWEPYHKVFSAWDLGIKDPTVIIFFQVIGETVRIFDYYEAADKPMSHFAQIIAQKESDGYIFAKHFPPHDIMQRESARGLTKRELYAELGVKFTEPVVIDIEDGIELVRKTFSKMWIDDNKCKKLIKALENYREIFDIKRKVYQGRPLHDWSSHACDAARYLCAALPKTRTSTSAEELDRRYNEAMLGENANLPNIFRNDLPNY